MGCMFSYLHRCWQSLLNTVNTSPMPVHSPSPCSALFTGALCSEKHIYLNLPLRVFPAHVRSSQAHTCMQQVLAKLLPISASHCVIPANYLCERGPQNSSPDGAASQTQTAAIVLTPTLRWHAFTQLCAAWCTQGCVSKHISRAI